MAGGNESTRHPTRPNAEADPASRAARELARLRQELERLCQQNADQANQIDEQQREIKEQKKRIADLEHQLALRQQNSTTTSKPPSSDGLAGRQRVRGRRRKSRRKPGGQPGHAGHSRPLVPLAEVDEFIDLDPKACGHCEHRLGARDNLGEPRRHQITELPDLKARTIEYRCHQRQCPRCGTVTQAAVPEELAGQFGPQLTALIAYLTVVCRMPRLVVQRLLESVLHIEISLGSTQKAWEEASAAVAGPYQELQAALPQQPVLNADETGHRTNAEKRWLWAFVAPTFVFYTIAISRGADVLQQLLGTTFAGILGSDRLQSYLRYAADQRQLCWSHLKRNLLGALELATTAAQKQFYRDVLAQQARLFRLWYRFRGDPEARGAPLTRQELIAKALPIETRLFALAERHVNAPDATVQNLARALFIHFRHFVTFVHEEGVEPTNNSAELALRTAVQMRKIMFGTRSADGEIALARLLTITRTCQLQQLNVLAYVTAAIRTHRRCQQVASLLPRR